MPTRLHRAAVLLLAPALALTLTACGGDDSTAKGFDAVSISGDFGKQPTFDWKKPMEPGKAESRTLIDGDGATLGNGDSALVNISVGDGWTQKTPITTYGSKYGSLVVPTSGSVIQPNQIGDLFVTFLQKYVKPGVKVGTRIAVTVGATQAFSNYAGAFPGAGLDIGNDDGLVIVADVVGGVPKAQLTEKAPSGNAAKPAAWAPKVVVKKGAPTSLNFAGTPAPSGKLETTTLIQGNGPAITDGSTAVVKYLGAVYKGKHPFDEDFSKSDVLNALVGNTVQPFQNSDPSKGLAVAPVKPGFSRGLAGAKVGSRILIQIPPKLGYGKKGVPPTIPGNSTLYFVIDILAAG